MKGEKWQTIFPRKRRVIAAHSVINIKKFYDVFYETGIECFIGIPDITLLGFEKQIQESQITKYISTNDVAMPNKHSTIQNINAPNPTSAIAMAVGYHVATNKCPAIYAPNSCLSEIAGFVNTIASENTMNIPMVILISVRGVDGQETPYHKANMQFTEQLMDAINVHCYHIDSECDYENMAKVACDDAIKNSMPVFLLVNHNAFPKTRVPEKRKTASLTKYDALKYLLSFLGENDYVVAASGNISKEIYDIRNKSRQSHSNDLLLASAFGQTATVAYGLATNSKNNVWCIDGDGSFMSNLGGVAISLLNTQRNLKYIIIDDECQSSSGGQKSHAGSIDIKKMLKAMGMKNTMEAYTYEDIKIGMLRLAKEKSALIIKVSPDRPFKIENDNYNSKQNLKEFKEKFGMTSAKNK